MSAGPQGGAAGPPRADASPPSAAPTSAHAEPAATQKSAKIDVKAGIEEMRGKTWLYLMAGGFAGLAGDFFTHPLDTARARIQFQRGDAPDARYNRTWTTVRHIYTNEGIRGFYKGFGSVLLFTHPGHAAYFGGYDIIKRIIYPSDVPAGAQSPAVHFLSGVFSNFIGGVIWNPQDVIKQRMQVQDNAKGVPGRYRNSLHCMHMVVKEEGMKGLFRGFWAQMLVYAPYVGIHFMMYEQSKMGLARFLKKDLDELPSYALLAGAMFSSMVAAYITAPFDVVKTRLQVQTVNEGGYKGVWDALRSIGRDEGARAYFKGAGARALWLGPNSALYEMFKDNLSDLL